jgi:hypothetical protein
MDTERNHAIVKFHVRDLVIVGKVLVTEKEFRRGRLSDYLNRKDILFLPVHDAHIFHGETNKTIDNKVFILLRKEAVDWIVPIKEPQLAFETEKVFDFS